jgi:hypothetical protein
MELQELKEEEFYCLIADDGNPQLFSLAPDFATCVGMVEMLASKGISRPLNTLLEEGYEILPIKLSITGNGSAEEGFQKAKQQLK